MNADVLRIRYGNVRPHATGGGGPRVPRFMLRDFTIDGSRVTIDKKGFYNG